jgi:prepilin-type N-terminal cleavage/methylation domain-containing protein
MVKSRNNDGFSLTEVLLAVGVLAIGMVFIAGVFPVAIHFTTIATERTIAAVVADEAFAKIKLYAIGDPCAGDEIGLDELEENELRDFNCPATFPAVTNIDDPNEFAYPSDPNMNISQRQYFWSALCRRVGEDPNRLVQVTVFVSRRVSPNLEYYQPADTCGGEVDWPTPDTDDRPVPVRVGVNQSGVGSNELRIEDPDEESFINGGYTIVDDETGRIYRVLERYPSSPDTLLLDRNWQGPAEDVWVVPPPVGGGRYPCIAVYQKVIRF